MRSVAVSGMVRTAVLWAATMLVLAPLGTAAQAADKVRVGHALDAPLRYELDTVKGQQLDQREGLDVEIQRFSNDEDAGRALIDGTVDLVAVDWMWVAKQRGRGAPITFVPLGSGAPSALVVADGSDIRAVADLVDKRIGIAGPKDDGAWLLLRAAAAHVSRLDLTQSSRLHWGPSQVEQEMIAGRLDAALLPWPSVVRLQSQGFRVVIDLDAVERGLGIDSGVALAGLAFREDFAASRPDVLRRLLDTIGTSQRVLRSEPGEWDYLRPMLGTLQVSTIDALRSSFTSGISEPWSELEVERARDLVRRAGQALGEPLTVPQGTFWGLDS
ncbi:ABC transporter substrate-binding protein [Zavarzinia sp. CC-PAN008]|uniref:ABC transporter substrate-binding protein n=1 Tax=Zavarzinia sp. CC-PAN008 TaxID=3243332 RepID=UPI003F749576